MNIYFHLKIAGVLLVALGLAHSFFGRFVYDSAIWRGHRFYTFMHVVFSMFWTYLVLIYGAALRVACSE
ncbi:MAG TPA: hypothetical protein VH369_00915 [Bryobacteraceae bacterium]|jgi:ABC-type bacteriocin/lantibiotic exporter with double-glycine peptidase domain